MKPPHLLIRYAGAGVMTLAMGWSGATRSQETQDNWRRITDPLEGAFTVEVLQGWHAEVGLRRRSALDPRVVINVRSPDGAISLFVGDHNIPYFTVPNELLALGGLREGMSYQPGPGVVNRIARYRTGREFALAGGAERIARECQEVKTTETRDLPAASKILDFGYAQGGVMVLGEAGEASFSCSLRGMPAAGYAFALTQKFSMPSVYGENAMWRVEWWTGFVAAGARAAEASEVLTRIVNSLRMDPDWIARQGVTTMQVSRIVSSANRAITQSINGAYWYRQAMQDAAFARGSQARRGVATYYDAELDIRRELPDRGYQWIDRQSNILSTETHEPPCSDCRELKRVPPR